MAGMGSRVCNLCGNLQRSSLLQKLVSPAACTVIPVRYGTNKHYDPKWRRHRGYKFLKIKLPDYDEVRREAGMSMDEMRAKMKREGIAPPRHGPQERNITLSCTAVIDEPYEPPEGDGVKSAVSLGQAKQTAVDFGRKGKSYLHLRRIRQFEEFDTTTFADEAHEIYVKVHECLQDIKKNEDELHSLVTEKAYPEMVWQLEKKTFRWKLHEQLEPPRVVKVRTAEMMSKENVFAQVTVRLHTSQMMAIYDRFGRLQYGNENVIKDVLEYVVFEKHVSEMYSNWRVHGKIIPDWMPPRTEVIRTLKKPKIDPEHKTDDKRPEPPRTQEEPPESPSRDPNEPRLAVA